MSLWGDAQWLGTQPRDNGLREEGESDNGREDDEKYDMSCNEMRDRSQRLRDVGKSDR